MIYSEVIGRLGADSELKTSRNGNKFVSMRVATNDYVNNENVTTWVNVMWSGDRALKMQEHLKKGSAVSVRGVLRTSMYKTKNNEDAVSVDIFADRIDFVGGGSGSTQSNTETTEAPQTNQKTDTVETSTSTVDDLPF